MAKKFEACVKECHETYCVPDYSSKEADLLACFTITTQDVVPCGEAQSLLVLRSSTS